MSKQHTDFYLNQRHTGFFSSQSYKKWSLNRILFKDHWSLKQFEFWSSYFAFWHIFYSNLKIFFSGLRKDNFKNKLYPLLHHYIVNIWSVGLYSIYLKGFISCFLEAQI